MARLNQKVLGKPKGVIADLSFGRRNNEVIIRARPESYMPGTDQKSVERRARFSEAVKYSAAALSMNPVKDVWKARTAGTKSLPQNLLFQSVYFFAGPSDVQEAAGFVPILGGFNTVVDTSDIDSSKVSVTFEALSSSTGINLSSEKFVQLCALIKCTDSVSDALKKTEYIPLVSEKVNLNFGTALSFNINLTDGDTKTYEFYSTHVTYLALFTLDEAGKAVSYSTRLTL